MVTVATTRTREDGLRRARERIHAAARAARLAGIRGGYFDHRASGPGHLVPEHVGELAPAGVEDASGEAGVRLDHVADLKLLEDDDAVALGVAAREYVKKVLALASHLSVQDGDAGLGLLAVLGSFLPCLSGFLPTRQRGVS